MKFLKSVLIFTTALLPLATVAQETKPAKPLQVELTQGEAQIILDGLNLAASVCPTNKAGCAIGFNKDEIIKKLVEANEKSQKK